MGKKISEKLKNEKIKMLLIFSIIIVIYFVANSMARYITKINDTHIQSATEFYFESDINDDSDNKEYIINDWNGKDTQKIEFSVMNYENTLLQSEENIKYVIKANVIDEQENIVSSDLINTNIQDENGKTIEETREETLLNTGLNKNKYVLNINSLSDAIENGATFYIQLTITALEPYTKEIKSKIILKTGTVENYETSLNTENSEYAVLNIKVNKPQTITIKYDNTKLTLDKSSKIVNDVSINTTDNISSFTILKKNLEENNNYEIYFIKLKDEVTLGTDIIIE